MKTLCNSNAEAHGRRSRTVDAVLGNDQMHRVAEMADAPRPQAPASGQPEHGGDVAGSNPAPVPNAAGQGRREATYPEPACSALDSEEPDDREERCDSCGETSRCLMRGLCPMCYELNGGTHD